jgi:Ulp1 family protease
MFVYSSGMNSISVAWDDYYRLEEGKKINDTIIAFYLSWIYDQWDEAKQKSCHIFNPSFYDNLSSKPKGTGLKTGSISNQEF